MRLGIALPSSDPVYRSGTAYALAAVVATQIGNLFAHRRRGATRNPLLAPALLIEVALLLVFIYVPPFQRLIGTAPFAPWQWLLLVAFVPLLWLADRLPGFLRRSS